ncbi:MAG: hypothetical protein U1F81_02495 [Verrucomicrobiaceae bacterium]
MKIVLLLSLLALSAHVMIADETYPEVTAFASKIKGVEWSLRGTFGLKGLSFDGKDVFEVKAGGAKGGVYESAFVDVGVLRLNFRGANTGWYFFSDDLRFITPLTVSGEVAFKLPVGPQPKVVREFPKDITGVVFESEPDERQLQPAKLRWTGTHLELAKQNKDQTWLVDKMSPIAADHRVFEVEQNGLLIWFAFSQDGKEAWLLQLENLFGGEPAGALKPATSSSAIAGLSAQQNELLAHIERLQAAGDKLRGATLARHLKRLLAKKPDLLKQVESRLK